MIDSTGLVLAALVNSGRQYNARAEAMEQAQYKTPDANGMVKVEYSYEPMPILSGLLTDLRIRVPLAAPTYDGMQPPDPMAMEYWAFDVRPEFYTFRPVKSLPLVSSLWLNVEAEHWKRPNPGDVDFTMFEIDMGFGGSASYVLGESLTATGRVGLGVLSPLFGLLSGGPKFNPAGEVEVGWRPFHTDKFGLMVSGIGAVGREFAVDRGVFATRIGLNVAVTLGNQVPKKRAPREETPPAASQSTLSGNVCAGQSQSPECMQVMQAAPDPVKILFAACVQATATAADSKNFSTQPGSCRTAGKGISKYVSENQGTLDPAAQRISFVAAAASFDFAGAGYELGGNRLGADHCAMIEATFNNVIGSDPNNPVLGPKVHDADLAVTECRKQFTCSSADGDMVCTSKTP